MCSAVLVTEQCTAELKAKDPNQVLSLSTFTSVCRASYTVLLHFLFSAIFLIDYLL